MVTEFIDFKNRCMAVKELCSYVVHGLGLRYEYLLIVGRHLDFIIFYYFRLHRTILEIATLNTLTFKTWVLLSELDIFV